MRYVLDDHLMIGFEQCRLRRILRVSFCWNVEVFGYLVRAELSALTRHGGQETSLGKNKDNAADADSRVRLSACEHWRAFCLATSSRPCVMETATL